MMGRETGSRRGTPSRARPLGKRLGSIALAAAIATAVACSSVATTPTGGGGSSANPSEAGSPAASPAAEPSASSPEGAAKPDPCKLVTLDELKTTVGVEFGDGVIDPFTAASDLTTPMRAYCTWTPADTTVFDSVTFVVEWVNASTTDTYTAFRVATSKAEPGIGDDAYANLGDGPGVDTSLRFKKGDFYVTLNAGGQLWTVTEDQLVFLAKAAASRM